MIVRDMWLTGFDVPCLHTMYLDKYMRAHGLMQAIARVNRVFGNKPGGLVVDYLGIAHELKQALATYTESGGKGTTALPQEDAVAEMPLTSGASWVAAAVTFAFAALRQTRGPVIFAAVLVVGGWAGAVSGGFSV